MEKRNGIKLPEGNCTKGYHHHRHHQSLFNIFHVSLLAVLHLVPPYVNINLIPSPGYLTPLTSLPVPGLSFCFSGCPAVICSEHYKSCLSPFFFIVAKISSSLTMMLTPSLSILYPAFFSPDHFVHFSAQYPSLL